MSFGYCPGLALVQIEIFGLFGVTSRTVGQVCDQIKINDVGKYDVYITYDITFTYLIQKSKRYRSAVDYTLRFLEFAAFPLFPI